MRKPKPRRVAINLAGQAVEVPARVSTKPKTGENRQCEVCGAPFYLYPSEARQPGTGRFCSRACKQQASGGEERACEVCGKTFYVPGWHIRDARAHTGRFCSAACKVQAQRGQ